MKYQYGDIHGLIDAKTHQPRNILVTGVTGFLGSHYVFWRSQLPGTIYVLVRAEDHAQAWQRTLSALEVCAQSYNLPLPDAEQLKQKIVCIPGDVTQPDCGIHARDLAQLEQAEISEVWHSAASLSFLQRHRERIINTNVAGTQTLMRVVKHLQIERFIYISTAYTAGRMSGEIPEQMHAEDVAFANCYEESKALAEQAVVDYCDAESMRWTILRPSIVTGPLITQCSGGTRFGLYGLAQEIYQLRETLRNVQSKLRLVGAQDSMVNMVSVDQVVFDMLYLESIEFGVQPIYHLSNSHDNHLSDVIRLIEKNMGTDALELVDSRDSKPSSLEKLFDRKTEFYSAYYKTEKTFLRSLPDHQPIGLDHIDNYMRNFKEELQSLEEGSIFARSYVKSWDDTPLCVHALGDSSKENLIIINAFGMPVDFVTPLAKRLSKQFHVITWDTRWVPGLTHNFDLDKCDSLTHARDLKAILDHFEIERCAVVGWSSGVQVALRAMSEYADRFHAGVLLNGGISLQLAEGEQMTEYEANIRSLLPKIGKSKRMAKLYCDLIYGASSQLAQTDQKSIGTILTSTDPHLLYMTSMPFRTPEALYRYANMMSRMFAEQGDAHTTGVHTPVLVYGGLKDEITHPDVARALTRALPNAELHLSQEDTHFAQFYESSVAQMIVEHVHKHKAPAATLREVG